MDHIIAFFSIVGSAEFFTSLIVITFMAITFVIMIDVDEKSTENKRKFKISYAILGITFLTYLIIAFTCLHISYYKSAPQGWFSNIPAKEQQMFTNYLQKNKYAAITIHKYEEIKYEYKKYHEKEQFKEKIINKKREQIQYEKEHDGNYREQQLQELTKNK